MPCNCDHMQTTASLAAPGRMKRQVAKGISMLEDSPSKPLGKYNGQFGGKPGSASKTMASMQRQYGKPKGAKVFYATKNKRKGGGVMAAMQRR